MNLIIATVANYFAGVAPNVIIAAYNVSMEVSDVVVVPSSGKQGIQGIPYLPLEEVNYSGTAVLDCTNTDTFEIVLGANVPINLQNAQDAQKITIRLKQNNAGGWNAVWGSMISYGTDITNIPVDTSPNSVTYVGMVYDSTTQLFHAVSHCKGATV